MLRLEAHRLKFIPKWDVVEPRAQEGCRGTPVQRVAGKELPLGHSPTAVTMGNACLISTSELFPCWLT
ncbi:unnamed protein product [Arctogadus glacialis]